MTRAIGRFFFDFIFNSFHFYSTSFAPHYVTTDVSYLTHPKAINNSWSDGLLVNFTIASNKNQKPLNRFLFFLIFLQFFLDVNFGKNFSVQLNILMGILINKKYFIIFF